MGSRKNKPNAFMCFVHEIIENRRPVLKLREAISHAGPIWKEMTASERAVYEDRAQKLKSPNNGAKRDAYGTKIADVERAVEYREAKERNMKRDIESTVQSSVSRAEFEKQKYYFIMVNYFIHTDPGDVFVPAELSLSEFSLGDGVTRKYHTFVNPAVGMYGYLSQAKEHASNTHELPLPPKAMGERNLTRIYDDIVAFVGNDKEDMNTPVYTHRDAIPIVKSALKFLTLDHPNVDINDILSVYSIQHLLFIMKESACEIGELEKVSSHHITDAYFDNDLYEHHAGLSCNYHEELDKSKFCTQSIVTRWAFMFCKYMCCDVAISLMPGRHTPKETKVPYVVNPGGSPPRKWERDNDYNEPGQRKEKYQRLNY